MVYQVLDLVKKRSTDFQGISRRNVKNVGRWVSDKMDMFFEEEDDDWSDQEIVMKRHKILNLFQENLNLLMLRNHFLSVL